MQHKTFWKKTKNKFNAKKSRCALNHIHDSAFEASYCNTLLKKLENAEIKEFVTQKRFDLHTPDGKKICAHYPDFLITNFDGSQCVHECKSKGTVRPEWKLKKALFEYEYKHIKYHVIWMKDFYKYKK